jgi:hypothetical protein
MCSRAVGLSVGEIVQSVLRPIVPLVALLVGLLAVFRVAVDHAGLPNGWVGDVRVGGAGICVLVGGALILLLSALPEAEQLRRFLLRRPA